MADIKVEPELNGVLDLYDCIIKYFRKNENSVDAAYEKAKDELDLALKMIKDGLNEEFETMLD